MLYYDVGCCGAGYLEMSHCLILDPENVSLLNSISLQEDGAAAHYAADKLFSPKLLSLHYGLATWTSYLASQMSQRAHVTAGCVFCEGGTSHLKSVAE
jgi:hypothetical protein